MLDSVLAENVMAVHRQKRSGVLTAVGIATTVRVAFQDGDPMALELGTDKDRLLADILLTTHRVTREQHGFLVEAIAQGHSVADVVTERTWASTDEIGRSLQAVVEEALLSFFGSKVQNLSFVDGAAPEFDFDRRAVRLRIAADVLLRTTSARIDEQRMILAEFGDFSGIYVFHEDSATTGDLTEAERRLLDLVDGRTTLEHMAVQLRESRVTVGRLVHGLVARKILRRAAATQPSTHLASAPTAPLTAPHVAPHESALRSATPTLGNFEPYRTDAPAAAPRQNRALLIVLLAVLGVLSMVGVAVMNYQERQRELAAMTDAFNELLAHSEWAKAIDTITEAKSKAAGDLQALRRVEGLQALLKQAMRRELEAAQTLITSGDFAQARVRLDRLPDQTLTTELRQVMSTAEQRFQEISADLQARVEKCLAAHDPRQAVALLAAHTGPDRERAAGQEALERWRVAQLEQAGSPGAPLQRRILALDAALSANPSARQAEHAALIKADIARQQARLQEALQRLSQRIDQGDSDGAMAEVERLGLRDLVAGSPLESDLKAVTGRTDQQRQAAAGFRERLQRALMSFADGGDLSPIVTDGEQYLTSLGTHSNPAFRALVDLAKDVQATVGTGSPESQIAALTTLASTRELGQDLAAALSARIDRLRSLEASAAGLLDTARANIRDGAYDQAKAILQDLVHKPDLRTTAARRAADLELADLDTRIARRQQLQDQLKAILARGDVVAGTTLAREMGLKYLPLSIDSLPSGAEVWHEQERVGTTPLILDISAAERVDYALELRLAGYETATVSGADAEAGWRLRVPLNRAASHTSDLHATVTIPPTPDGEGWLTGSRACLLRVDASGAITSRTAFGDATVDDPIRAAPSYDGSTVVVPTRNQVAIAIDGDRARRMPLPIATDFPVVVYRSAVVVDRVLLIAANSDGVIAASNPGSAGTASTLWRTPAGAPCVAGPRLVGDRLLVARKDGTLAVMAADDGSVLSTQSLGDTVVAAWPTATGLAGATATEHFRWDGTTLQRERLPAPAMAAAEGVMVSTGLRVFLRHDATWTDLGLVEAAPSIPPLAWDTKAVIVTGRHLRVMGERGFGLTAAADVLPPTIIDHHLLVVSQDGNVRVYEP